jgi:O-antigen ligase
LARRARPSAAPILAGFLVNAAIAVIPLLMIATHLWQLTYGILFTLAGMITLAMRNGDLDQKTILRAAGLFALLAVPAVLSMAGSTAKGSHLSTIALIGLYALVGPLLLRADDKRGLDRFFISATILTALVTLVLMARADQAPSYYDALVERRGAFDFQDMGIGLDPNFIGLLTVVAGLATASLSARYWRMAGLAGSLFVAWLVSSRDAILGIAVGHAVAILARRLLPEPGAPRPGLATTWAMAVGGLLALLLTGHWLMGFVDNDVLLLNDPERGLGSGFTNRIELWQAAWALWKSHPVFGVGYGEGLTDFGYTAYAHNLVLVLLSETGLVGLGGFVAFTVLSMRNALRFIRTGHRQIAIFMISSMAIYWSYGIFEGKAVSAGNPLSAMFFLLMFAGAAAPPPARS